MRHSQHPVSLRDNIGETIPLPVICVEAGYEYLAELYLRLGNPDALPLIRKAIELVQKFYDEDTLDYKVLIEVRTKVGMIERAFGHLSEGSPF